MLVRQMAGLRVKGLALMKSRELLGHLFEAISSQAQKWEGSETIRKEYAQAGGSARHRKVKI